MMLQQTSTTDTATPRRFFRHDGVPITRDLNRRKSSACGTDPDGFDADTDAVGAGIYGGNVVHDDKGNVVIGQQYQDHNPRPGPMYDGTGYTMMSRAIVEGPAAVAAALRRDPSLVYEVGTGGATPLHMCGMSRRRQRCTALIVEAGGNVNAVDSYGGTPLHRMASNNLAAGAEALLRAGAEINATDGNGQTALAVALMSGAMAVADVLSEAGATLCAPE